MNPPARRLTQRRAGTSNTHHPQYRTVLLTAH
jgi:hypothetical protein